MIPIIINISMLTSTTRFPIALCGAVLVLLLGIGMGVPVQAQQVPEVITYQGTLTDPDGNAVNSAVDLVFRFYDGPGDAAQLPEGDVWEESYTGILVQNGRFSVQLGSQTENGLPDALFDNRNQLWLEIAVDGEALSRTRMTSTAFAREAQSVVDGAAVQSLNGLTDAVTLAGGENVTISQDGSELTISATVPSGGLTSVQTNETLSGVGTEDEPLGLAEGAAVRSLTALDNSGDEVTTLIDAATLRAGDNVEFVEQSGGLTISAAGPEGGISSVSSNQTLDGNGTASDPLRLAPDAVTSANIFDGEVKSDDIGAGAVTEGKILDGAVSAAKINDQAAVKSLNTITGAVSLISSDESLNLSTSPTDSEVDLAINPAAVVADLNGLTGPLSLVGGDNVSIESNDTDQLTISSVDTGLPEVATDATLTGTGTDDDELGIAENGIGRTELAGGVVVDELNGLTGGVTIQTSGGAQISRDTDTNTITIDAGAGSGSSDIQSISSPDGTIDVVNNDGSVSIDVADGGVGTAQLADNAVSGAVIQDGSIQGVDLADEAVGTDQLADGAVTASQLAGGSVSTAALQNDAVTSAQIADGTITSDDLDTGSVGSTEIQDGAVTRDDLSGNAAVLGLTPPSNNTLRGNVSLAAGSNITISDSGNEITIDAAATGLSEVASTNQFNGDGTSENPLSLALDAVTQAEIASGAVGSDELQSNTAVTGLSIQNNGSNTIGPLQNGVTLNGGSNISLGRDGSIVTIDASAAGLQSVTSDETLTGSGTSGDPLGIANGGVDTDQLANGAVNAAALANNAVDTGALQDGAVTGVKIADGALVGGSDIGISRTSDDALEIAFTGDLSSSVTSVSGGTGLSDGGQTTGDVTLSIENGNIVGSMLDADAIQPGANINVNRNNGNFVIGAPSALTSAVTTLNGLSSGVSLVGSDNVTIEDNGTNQITISSVDTGLLSVASDATLAGEGTADSELGIAENGVGRTELASGVVVDQLNGLTGGVTIETSGGAQISQDTDTNTITIDAGAGSGSSDIQSISSPDGTIDVVNNDGSVSIDVADGGVGTAQIAENAITDTELTDDAVDTGAIQSGAVTTEEIASGAVTAADLAANAALQTIEVTNDGNSVSGTGNVSFEGTNGIAISADNGANTITFDGSSLGGLNSVATESPLTGDGTTGNPVAITENSITATQLAENAVEASELDDGAVDEAALDVINDPTSAGQVLTYGGDNNFEWEEITTSGVLELEGLDGELTFGGTAIPVVSASGSTIELGIGSGAVGSDELQTGAVDSDAIAGGAVGTTELASEAVTTSEISPSGANSGQALITDGTTVSWGQPGCDGRGGRVHNHGRWHFGRSAGGR